MKLFFVFIVCLSFSVYSQDISTTLKEAYKGEIKLDFSQSSGRIQGEWTQGQSMPYPRYYGGSVMHTVDDTTWLYIFGGDTTSNGHATKSCLRYNVNSDMWEYIDSLPGPLRVNSAAKAGNKFYTLGGFEILSSDTATAKFYEYDINTNTWAELPELPEAVFYHKALGYEDSLVYIMGGVKRNPTVFLDRVLLYNTITRQFRDATPLPEQKANFAPVFANNSIVITGGIYSVDSLTNQTLIAEISEADRAEISYLSLAEYPIKVHSHFGFPGFNDEKIIFFGGSTSTEFNPVNDSYSYDFFSNVYDTLTSDLKGLSAFYSGYNHVPINSGADIVVTAVIAGGIREGFTLTGQTWVYRDTIYATGLAGDDELPQDFVLYRNYPNPFNPTTKIKFTISDLRFTTLKVYDVLGREVATLVNEEKQPGVYEVEFQSSVGSRQLASGIYYYQLKAGSFIETKKMILLR
jgi:hypothetical protein